ncbi:MAG: hypothetical protein DDT40_01806 [candidate division WS2 bacterium]|nr:hypothetical protein [Candidatus Psychracetigena formicireducens]
MMDENVVEGSQVTSSEKYVPLTKYVGVKEMLGKREEALTVSQNRITELETEVKNLGEHVAKAKAVAVDSERIKTLESERDAARAELSQTKHKALLKEHNIKPEDVENMNEEQIQAFIKGKSQAGKPGADLGTGGNISSPSTARGLIREGFDVMFPKGK